MVIGHDFAEYDLIDSTSRLVYEVSRMTRCLDPLDKPRTMERVRLPHPTLPMESKAISYSGSQAAFR